MARRMSGTGQSAGQFQHFRDDPVFTMREIVGDLADNGGTHHHAVGHAGNGGGLFG